MKSTDHVRFVHDFRFEKRNFRFEIAAHIFAVKNWVKLIFFSVENKINLSPSFFLGGGAGGVG